MVLLSNINVDLGLQTVILNDSVDGNTVENITFDGIAQTVTFSARDSILINFIEFLSFADQVNIFQTAILFNFPSISVSAIKPFNKLTSIEFHDVGSGNWDLTVSPLTGDDVVSYEATKSSLKFLLNPRSSDVSLTFPEWILFLQSFNHYRLSIKNF